MPGLAKHLPLAGGLPMRSPALRVAFAASALLSAALSAGPALAAPRPSKHALAASRPGKHALATSRPSKRYTIEQFIATTTVGGASFSPDESKILFSSNQSGIFNAYVVPVAGGEPQALTASKT